jgi:long-chain acyl-CoA synthetase
MKLSGAEAEKFWPIYETYVDELVAINRTKYDLTSVKRASYGGAPAARELVERIQEVFPNLRKTLSTAYGLTETASVATVHGGDDYFAHPGSVGRAAPTIELRIVDEEGRDMPAGERGEVWIKGPTVMNLGYWRRPDVNATALTDGWFHSGDIGYLDADGFLFLVDRAKDMIIRGGEKIFPSEVEQFLYRHPKIQDVQIVGVPSAIGATLTKISVLADSSLSSGGEARLLARTWEGSCMAEVGAAPGWLAKMLTPTAEMPNTRLDEPAPD